MVSYEKHGFGLNLVELRESHESIGICGLLKRATLSDPDIGYAFLPEFWSQGYAVEAARGVIAHASANFGLSRVVAITSLDNIRSERVLEKIGFTYEKTIRLTVDSPEIKLFASSLDQ
jgi:RimJ/RimL family protein N-acetyltransferase